MASPELTWAEILQAVSSVAGAILTAGALFYAIWSGRQTGKLAEKSLQESIENRKDDMMPILSLHNTVSTNAKSGLITFELNNIGNGPLYDLESKTPGCVVYGVRPQPSDNQILYEVRADLEALRNSVEKLILYDYKDMYGRSFTAEQEYSIESDDRINIKGKFKIPIKNG